MMTEQQVHDYLRRAEMEQRTCSREFFLQLDALGVSVVIGNLQLALRHPDVPEKMREIVEAIVSDLTAQLRDAGLQATVFLAELGSGWGPAM